MLSVFLYSIADLFVDNNVCSIQSSSSGGAHISLREKIYRKIRDDIANGRLYPGERLLESKLAQEFDCSRSPIREALRLLESDGLLVFEQNKGTAIRKLSISEIDDTYDLLALLESHAAYLATPKAFIEGVIYLQDLHNELRGAAKNDDLIKWLSMNEKFHRYFHEHSNNKLLVQVLENLKSRIYQYRHITIRIPRHLDEYIEQHACILTAYEANDHRKAEEHMRIHIETVKRVLISYLNDFPGTR